MTILEEDVFRLDVAVDYSLLVRVRQRGGDLADDGDGVIDRELMFALQPLAQRFARDERHHVEHEPVSNPSRYDRQNVRMLQMRRDFALALEPRRHHVAGELGRQNLDDDLAVEREIRGEEQSAHAPALQLFVHAIAVGEDLSQMFEQIVHESRGGS